MRSKALQQEIDHLVDCMWEDPGWREDNPNSTKENCVRYALEDIVENGPNFNDAWPPGPLPKEEEKAREAWRRIYREAKRELKGK